MSVRYSRLAVVAVAMLLSLASNAGAVVLWDQSNWNQNNEGSIDLSSTSCSQISGNTKVHLANDVHFNGPVVITTVRIYETPGNVQAASQAYLWIAPKTGPMPTTQSDQLELAAISKPITSAIETINGIQTVVVTCANLNIPLTAGDYWVSLTPRHSLGLFPYTVHLTTSGPVVGDPTAGIVACTVNSNWLYPLSPNSPDYAIKIEGDVVVPSAPASWGRMKTLYR